MLTYQRTDQIAEACRAVLAELSQAAQAQPELGELRLLVVDNDPTGSARAEVEQVADERVTYVVESTPGIAAARNRALDETVNTRAIVFIDDDERPAPGWLSALVGCWQRSGADGVAGPVRSILPESTDPWVRLSGWYDREHRAKLASGTTIATAATNNLLLDRRSVEQSGVRFDTAFGLSGGSDNKFTLDFSKSGARMVWCAEAVVLEQVPEQRASRSYVSRRNFSLANVSIRSEIASEDEPLRRLLRRARELGIGAARVVLGAGYELAGRILRRIRWQARGRLMAMRGAGAATAALGVRYFEYRRDRTTKGGDQRA